MSEENEEPRPEEEPRPKEEPSEQPAEHLEDGATVELSDEEINALAAELDPDPEPEAAAAPAGARSADPSELQTKIEELDTQNTQLNDDLARARADLYNLQQEYSAYVRRSKSEASGHRAAGQAEVASALVPVLDDIVAAREAGDLNDGPFAAIATKLENVLENQFQVTRYGTVGIEFDPNQDEALMAETNAEVDKPTVAQVLQPGYRIGERILRPAKVMVHKPE